MGLETEVSWTTDRSPTNCQSVAARAHSVDRTVTCMPERTQGPLSLFLLSLSMTRVVTEAKHRRESSQKNGSHLLRHDVYQVPAAGSVDNGLPHQKGTDLQAGEMV